MDQVKVALAVLKKYHFWLLTVLVLGVGIGVWFMATASRATEFKDHLAKIEAADKSLGSVSGDNPPNCAIQGKGRHAARGAQAGSGRRLEGTLRQADRTVRLARPDCRYDRQARTRRADPGTHLRLLQ